jgi:hypothetical protein
MKYKLTIELPMQMPMGISIRPFAAIQTLVTCSAALETIGRRIMPMNPFGTWYLSATSSIESTTVCQR